MSFVLHSQNNEFPGMKGSPGPFRARKLCAFMANFLAICQAIVRGTNKQTNRRLHFLYL